MEPTGSGDDIITNSIQVMCQFILSCRKYLYKSRCFFFPEFFGCRGSESWVWQNCHYLSKTPLLGSVFFFIFWVRGGGVNCIEQNHGEGRRQCSDIKGERSSRFYLSFLNSAFKYWSEFGMKKSFRALGRRVECLYGPRQVWRAGLEVMHTKSYCAGIIYG